MCFVQKTIFIAFIYYNEISGYVCLLFCYTLDNKSEERNWYTTCIIVIRPDAYVVVKIALMFISILKVSQNCVYEILCYKKSFLLILQKQH